MDNEKYTYSFIDSTYDFLEKLQYLGRNDQTLVKALSLFKLFHWLYAWADWYEISEENKIKLEKLINCLILRNSNLVLPTIPAQSFYTNVNSPQNIWTWRILDTNSNVTTITSLSDKIITFTSEPEIPISISINKVDVDGLQNGITTFSRTFHPNEQIIVTSPLISSTQKRFQYMTVNSISQGNLVNEVAITMNEPKSVIVYYADPVPPLGSISLTKDVVNLDSDETVFTVVVSQLNSSLTWTKTFSHGQTILFDQLELGTYIVEELPIAGYTNANAFAIILTEGEFQHYVGVLENSKIETGTIGVFKSMAEDSSQVFQIYIYNIDTDEQIYGAISIEVPYLFQNVPYGTYRVFELLPEPMSNWMMPSFTPYDGEDPTSGLVTVSAEFPNQTVIVHNSLNT